MKAYKKYFTTSVRESYPNDFQTIQTEIDRAFQSLQPDIEFSKRSSNPMDRRLEISAYFLALVMVLDKRNVPQQEIRKLCVDIAHAYVKPENGLQAWMKKLPQRLIGTWVSEILLPAFNKRVSQLAHPDGFKVKILTDPKETFGLGYGFDILECGICKQFTKHHYQHYANILCDVDYVTSGLAGLELIRSGTIANGASKCDFRFKRT
jgi:hypothetical protein